jgi:hypothetical protein
MRRRSSLVLSSAVAMLAAVSPALAQQGPNFNRVTTLRREVMVGPMRAGRDASYLTETASRGAAMDDPLRPYTRRAPGASSEAHPYSSWNQEPRRALPPVPVQTRTTPHTYYPGMRSGQSLNRNIATHGRCTQSRAGFLAPGVMTPVPSLGQIRR